MTEEQLKELKDLLDELKRLSKATVEHVLGLGLLDLTKMRVAEKRYETIDTHVEKSIGMCVEIGTDAAFEAAKEILMDAITIKNEGMAQYTQLAVTRAKAQLRKGLVN